MYNSGSYDYPLILVVGWGSVGRRHFRNLQSFGNPNIIIYRTGKSTLDSRELIDFQVETDFEKALQHNPKGAIIANPTSLHIEFATAAAAAGCHLFIEKPISHTLHGLDKLKSIVEENSLQVLVGFQFRFHPGLKKVKQLIGEGVIGRVVSASAHWGEYLPDWHPWEDYRQSYSARADLGGGVILTLCHPFDYMRWLFGEIAEVSALTGNVGGLNIAVEDTASIQMLFTSGALGHIHLDYVQRPASHTLNITGQQGIIQWDNQDGEVRWYCASRKTWDVYQVPQGFERNWLFAEEIRHFIACIDGCESPLCTLDDGIKALQIALAAKQAASERKVIKLQ